MLLAIDYGRKHFGLAIGDKNLKIAFPYQTIENKGFGSVLNQIKAICQSIRRGSGLAPGLPKGQKEEIELIIIGRPLGMTGKKTRQTKLTDRFVAKLKRQINIKIKVEDERLTSQAAEKFLTPSEHNHAVAAMIILQNYLDRIKQ